MDNSPLKYWNRVRTPLLLVHGELDGQVSIENSEESFNGLQRLERPVVLARYRRLGHEIQPEVRQRIRGWWREHLLGAQSLSHIAAQESFFFGESADQ